MKKKAKIVARRKADKNHEVITVTSSGGDACYRKTPCAECPWRKDSPIGAFPAEAYRISASTAYDMAQTTFACHMAGKEKPTTCAGFLLQNSEHNLQVRLALIKNRMELSKVHSEIELYEDYRAMAEANGVDPEDPVLEPCRGATRDRTEYSSGRQPRKKASKASARRAASSKG